MNKHHTYTPEELSQLHATLYDILAEITRVCAVLQIPYFIQGGTAIGAFFEQAILPWDDDIDVGMTRDAYNRFLREAPAVLGEAYFLQSPLTEPNTPFYFIKVRKRHTAFVEADFAHLEMEHGIFVDVFPFDKVPDNALLQRIHRKVCQLLNCCFMAKSIWLWSHCGKCEVETPSPRGYLPCLFTRVVNTLLSKQQLYRLLAAAQGCFNGKHYTYYNMVLMPRDHIAVQSIAQSKPVALGPLTVTAPDGLETYLRHHYPRLRRYIPVEEQQNHRPKILSFTAAYPAEMVQEQSAGVDVAVLILFFNRPEPLSQVFQQVRRAKPTRLFLYQDGPRTEADMPRILACRKVVEQVDWPCEVQRLYQTTNYGCDPSEYISQKWAFSHVEKCIVLEDDDVPAVSFFRFCKEMLDRYEQDTRIAMIAGFNPEETTAGVSSDYLFSTNFSIWGWASWRRVIDQWDEHYTFLDNAEQMRLLQQVIQTRGYRKDFIRMCQHHRRSGKAFYETIFHAAILLNSGLSIVPTKNMINNLGATADSTHFGGSVQTLPRGYRRIFTMRRFEVAFPLKHPLTVMENTAHKEAVYRIMAWRHPWVKVARSLEELLLNLRYGNFAHIRRSLVRRVQKWLGREIHQ